MPQIRLVSPGRNGFVTNEYGMEEKPPADWSFLPAGDAAVTRKVTAMGPCWRVQVKKGRRIISKGIWAPATHIAAAQQAVKSMRSAPDYERKKASAAKSRTKKQNAYQADFQQEVRRYLKFHQKYQSLEETMAQLVTEHAIPIGSGTVARTSQIPVNERAAKAVIAWMRHHTTPYDQLKIPRIKGERRRVRRKLAEKSVNLLNNYRKGQTTPADCPLKLAVDRLTKGKEI